MNTILGEPERMINIYLPRWPKVCTSGMTPKPCLSASERSSATSYSKTINNEYIESIHQMSYSSLSNNGMVQIFSFLIKWLYGTL